MLDTFLENENISPEIVPIRPDSSISDIYNGYYDLRLTISLHNRIGYKIVQSISQIPFGFYALKKNEQIIEDINMAMHIIDSIDTLYDEKLYLEYTTNFQNATKKLSEDALNILRSKNLYRVRVSKDHPLLSYIDDSGEVQGLAIDVMNYIANETGINVEFLPMSVDENPYEEYDINFSLVDDSFSNQTKTRVSYATLSMYAIKQKVLKIKTIAVLNYNSADKKEIGAIFPTAEIILTESLEEAQKLFRSGQVDCMVASEQVILSMLNDSNINAYDVQALNIDFDMTFSVSPDLSDAIYRELYTLAQNIDEKFVNTSLLGHGLLLKSGLSFSEFVRYYFVQIIIVVVIVISAFLSLYFLLTQKKQKVLQKLLDEDELTGLMTRRKFLEVVKKYLQNTEDSDLLLMVLDINNFKFINSTYGYNIGNEVLQLTAQKILKIYGEKAIIARDGNDKFLLLVHSQVTEKNSCGNENSNDCVFDIGSYDFAIKISKGIYKITDLTESVDYMLDCAHYARIYGKRTVGSTSVVFSEEMRLAQIATQSIISRIEYATKYEEFYPVFQPKYNLKTETLIGAEALVRWKDRYGKIIYPNEFISIVESNGLLAKIDVLMLEKVCQYISESEITLPRISLNVSLVSLTHENFVTQYMKILEKYSVSPSSIELEITESAFTKNFELIYSRITELKKIGFTITMDDFGRGISSLAYLKDMNIGIIKLDGEFLRENLLSQKGECIVEHIISFANALSIETIAECVETEIQVNILKKLGCDVVQGYYYSKPLEKEDFTNLLINFATNK